MLCSAVLSVGGGGKKGDGCCAVQYQVWREGEREGERERGVVQYRTKCGWRERGRGVLYSTVQN